MQIPSVSELFILKHDNINEWIPENILKKNNWKSFYESLFLIHNPSENTAKKWELVEFQRICFDELLTEQIAIRLAAPKPAEGLAIRNERKLANKLLSMLPFSLTDSQEAAIDDILNDMVSGKPMARLVQGDVASGKTIVAIIAALNAIESGFQCALLAPTGILARQHFEKISRYFSMLGLKTELLTANEKGKKRKEILLNIESGISKMLVGTHAILTDNVKFNKLGLVIIDEQHKFGVNQRLDLIDKGATPHILSMTATPIPRTVILSQYGDIALSSITEKPKGRLDIVTKAVPMSRIESVFEAISRIIRSGEKVYWVCQLIEESDKMDYTCVINRRDSLKQIFGEDVEMLHGRMKEDEKGLVFERFTTGKFHILVSTTVIEVGVDVHDATVIIIENAERFGLAQLHQLRGRVGRSDLQSYCILLYDERNTSKIAFERINTIKETDDGFAIAEKDLILRGGGEIFGTRQSGQKRYKTFDFNDPETQKNVYQLLKQASTLASEIINTNNLEQYTQLLKIFAKQNSENLKKSF
ncbi:hypothetical protein FACS1894113_4980 [Alphaproteobacteria bacterium]|nr:hypothetical protein FACS1894113_4980 [Alphaproteobacteria bacterium]